MISGLQNNSVLATEERVLAQKHPIAGPIVGTESCCLTPTLLVGIEHCTKQNRGVTQDGVDEETAREVGTNFLMPC